MENNNKMELSWFEYFGFGYLFFMIGIINGMYFYMIEQSLVIFFSIFFSALMFFMTINKLNETNWKWKE